MKRRLVVAGAVLVGLTVAAPLAVAQDSVTPSCAEALRVYSEAFTALDVAVEADDAARLAVEADAALAAAVAADAVLEEAQADLDAALPPVLEFNPNVYPDDTVPTLDELTPALLEQILADPDLGGGARAEVETALVAFAAFDVAAAAAHSDAVALQVTANASDAAALQVVADQTDVVALTAALAQAQAQADVACEGQPGDPGPVGPTGPRGPAGGDGFGQVGGRAPIGGVETGA